MKIAIGAGGTGGHVFPAQALAKEIQSRGGSVILFTDERGAKFISDFPAERVVVLPAGNIRAGSAVKRVQSGIRLLQGVMQARRIIKNAKLNATIGFGGYPSFPSGIAAFLCGAPLYLHEQNVILGKTNKFLSRFAKKILLSFPDTKNLPENAKFSVTGNPVREGIIARTAAPYELPVAEFRLLITGGSQGAKFFAELFPKACAVLPDALKQKLSIVHQAGGENSEHLQEQYASAGVRADIRPFIQNMGEEIAKAHLCVARAGASSLTELTIIGRPGLLIPLPTAADDQQTLNAKYLTEHSAGILAPQSELTPEKAATLLEKLMRDPIELQKIAHQAKLLGRPDAVKNIYDAISDET